MFRWWFLVPAVILLAFMPNGAAEITVLFPEPGVRSDTTGERIVEELGLGPTYVFLGPATSYTIVELAPGQYNITWTSVVDDSSVSTSVVQRGVLRSSSGSVYMVPPEERLEGVEVVYDSGPVTIIFPGNRAEATWTGEVLDELLLRIGANLSHLPAWHLVPPVPIPIFGIREAGRPQFLIECESCHVLLRSRTEAVTNFDRVTALISDDGQLIAIQIMTITAGSTVLSEPTAARIVNEHLRHKGFNVTNLTPQSLLFLRTPSPHIEYTWAVRAEPAAAQPWTNLTLRQDGVTGDVLGEPFDLLRTGHEPAVTPMADRGAFPPEAIPGVASWAPIASLVVVALRRRKRHTPQP